MSEIQYYETVRLDDFQDFTESTLYDDASAEEGWEAKFADLLTREGLEFMVQHGRGIAAIQLPQELDPNGLTRDRETIDNMADELGDLLWFGFTIARHLRTPAKTLCSSALAAHTGREMPPMESFSDLQTAVMANAEHIRVLNKRGLYIPDASDDIRYTSLEANPPYVFTRHLNRLVRSLEQGANDLSPLTMTSVEPIADLKLALAIS